MKVSIIVPFYKGKHYLKDCLESIALQKMRDFETLLVLDHVEENVDDLIEEYREKAALKVFLLEGKKGVASARNLALSKAAGKYVYFLDSDDYIIEDTLECLVNDAEAGAYDLTMGVVERTWHKRISFIDEYERKEAETTTVKADIVAACFEREVTVLGKLYDREFLNEIGAQFDEEFLVHCDMPFLACCLKNMKRPAANSQAVYAKRSHNDPIQLPALSQMEDSFVHDHFMDSFLKAKEAAGEDQELIHKLEYTFYAYFAKQYRKGVFPPKGKMLTNRQFKRVCAIMKQCSKKSMEGFNMRDKMLLKGYLAEKEGQCIFWGSMSRGWRKFKNAKNKDLAIYRFLYRFIFQRMQLKENWIVFESFLGKNYADSCKYIYLYMDENLQDKYKFIWAVKDMKTEIPGSAIKVKYHGLRHIYYLARAKYWVNNMRQPKWRKKRREQVFLETWHGTPLKRLVFDMDDIYSATATYKSDFYKQSRQWNYLVSDNPFSTDAFHSAFLFPKEKMLQHGYPRNDIMHWDNKEELAKTIREKLGIPTDKKTVLYAPTWRDDQYYEAGKYKFDLALDLDKMREVLGDEYVVLLRTHYFIADALDLSKYEGFAYNVCHYDDISELYLISDICITDYSSVFFDYANLKRPMLFYTYDLANYRDKLRGFYIDMEKELPGPLLFTTEEVIEAILNISQIEEDYKIKYNQFYDRFCCWDDGHAADRIVQEVFEVSCEEQNSTRDKK